MLQLKPEFVVHATPRTARHGSLRRRVYAAESLRYAETAPPPELAADVLCFFTLHVNRQHGRYVQQLLPDLTVDVISLNGAPFVVVGPPTAPVLFTLPAGSVVEGVRLRAAAARRLFDCSAADLVNRVMPFENVLRSRFRGTGIAHAESVQEAVGRLLRDDLATNEQAVDPIVRAAVDWMSTNGHGTVDDLSQQMGYSGRELRRRFVTSLGIGPKLVQRMMRVQQTLRILSERGGRISLTELALDCGFADQAHLTREVVRFTNLTPSAIRTLVSIPDFASRGFSDAPVVELSTILQTPITTFIQPIR